MNIIIKLRSWYKVEAFELDELVEEAEVWEDRGKFRV